MCRSRHSAREISWAKQQTGRSRRTRETRVRAVQQHHLQAWRAGLDLWHAACLPTAHATDCSIMLLQVVMVQTLQMQCSSSSTQKRCVHTATAVWSVDAGCSMGPDSLAAADQRLFVQQHQCCCLQSTMRGLQLTRQRFWQCSTQICSCGTRIYAALRMPAVLCMEQSRCVMQRVETPVATG
jgi:hypothetical protein